MSMNVADSEMRPALGLASNKSNKSVVLSPKGKPTSKPLRKVEKSPQETGVGLGEEKRSDGVCSNSSSITPSARVSSILCRQAQFNSLSLNASCSSDASSDSFRSRGSTGRISRTSSVGSRRKLSKSKSSVSCDGVFLEPCGGDDDGLLGKKRCAWVTPNADPLYATFHDVEWGVPEHDDKKLFELLVLSGALAELTWPVILSKRQIFREVFLDFDPVQVAKLSEKKIVAPGSAASALLSELKLRSIVENARQISKVIEEFGSFDKYIWSFVNHKPIISRFRYPRQVPVKTPKADVISKDLVRRGFRSVSPTVIYSFMQAAGITNDHLVSCFRFHDCLTIGESKEENGLKGNSNDKKPNDAMETDITRAIGELNFCSEL